MARTAQRNTTRAAGLPSLPGLEEVQTTPSPANALLQCSGREHVHISRATARNWKKLQTCAEGRLTRRANKRCSTKRIVPTEYFSDLHNVPLVRHIVAYIDEAGLDIADAIRALGFNLLRKAGISEKEHVLTALKDYNWSAPDSYLAEVPLPENEFDILGAIYQSLLPEGKKNASGSYYTPQRIAHSMTGDVTFTTRDVFLDPCCGSGAFLLSVAARHPEQIVGIDRDEVAVFIATINLLRKYRHCSFLPRVYCCDFLEEQDMEGIKSIKSIKSHTPLFAQKRFSFIATNPPWGALERERMLPGLCSRETFSHFFVHACNYLTEDGIIRFLFPQAILNVRAHSDIRKFILESAGLVSITLYDEMFSAVTTKYLSLECCKKTCTTTYTVQANGSRQEFSTASLSATRNFVFNFLTDMDMSIIRTVRERGVYTLKDSVWGLGIVTGDNAGKLFSEYHDGLEQIYTGKEIQPYVLKPANTYIRYDRNALQQVAREEIYRSPEKLLYKFISKRLVFACDTSQSLCLNSANILIPAIPSMSCKASLAFLNSSVFQFLYMRLFGESKILKGNLLELPFPKLSEEENQQLTDMVTCVLHGDSAMIPALDTWIFSFYRLDAAQSAHIENVIHGHDHA